MTHRRVHERWAELRFAIVGPLLASPPSRGTLRAEIAKLAAREWRHPVSGRAVRFGYPTIERWLCRARREKQDPVGILRRKRRQDAGQQPIMTATLRQALLDQYAMHPAGVFACITTTYWHWLRDSASYSRFRPIRPSDASLQLMVSTSGARLLRDRPRVC